MQKKENFNAQLYETEPVRLDKWLWAARFFKTRTLATKAVKSSKIKVDGVKAKTSKKVHPKQIILINKNQESFEIIITALASVRRDATFARTLYKETKESIDKRDSLKLLKKLSHQTINTQKGRPTKKDRRDLNKLKGF